MNTTIQSEPVAPVFGFQPLAAIALMPDTEYLQLSRRKENGEMCLNVVWTDDKCTFDEYEDDEVGWEIVGLMLASTVRPWYGAKPVELRAQVGNAGTGRGHGGKAKRKETGK